MLFNSYDFIFFSPLFGEYGLCFEGLEGFGFVSESLLQPLLYSTVFTIGSYVCCWEAVSVLIMCCIVF